MKFNEKIQLLRSELGLSLVNAKKAIAICCYDETLEKYQERLSKHLEKINKKPA